VLLPHHHFILGQLELLIVVVTGLVLLVLKELKVVRVLLAHRVLSVLKVLLEHRVLKEYKVM